MRITGIWGDHFVPPEEIDALSLQSGPAKRYSTVLLCVKSKDTEAAAREGAPLLREDGIMVSIQNGLNNWEAIASSVGEERTVGALSYLGRRFQPPASPGLQSMLTTSCWESPFCR